METDMLSPFQVIRIAALENAVNQLSPNDEVESILQVAKSFEEFITTGKINPPVGDSPKPTVSIVELLRKTSDEA